MGRSLIASVPLIIMHKPDKHANDIIAELRTKYNLYVFDASQVGFGFPDIVIPYNGFNWFIEIKTDKNYTLTKAQKVFHPKWHKNNGQLHIVFNAKQILDIIGYAPIITRE